MRVALAERSRDTAPRHSRYRQAVDMLSALETAAMGWGGKIEPKT